MFSENQKISGRQAFRLLTYDLLGLGTLLVPTVLAQVAGRDGIFCIIIGTFAGLLYLKAVGAVVKDMGATFPEYLEQRLGAFLGRLIQAGYLLYFVLLAGYTAYLFSDIVLKNLLREESFWLVLTLILLLAGYGLWGGIEGRARVYEILFWFIMIPLFLMLFFALNEVETDYWMPVFITGTGGVLGGSYYVFLCFALVFLVLFLSSYTAKKETLLRAGRTALIFTGTLHAVLYLILLGVFGAGALSVMEFPAVTMMSTVKISGGFLKRADAFMFGIWFFTLYALLNSMVFYGGALLAHLLRGAGILTNKKKPAAEHGTEGVILLLVLLFAGIFYRSEAACNDYELFLWYAGTPFIVIIPLLLAISAAWRNGGRKRKADAPDLRSGKPEKQQDRGKKAKQLGMAAFLLVAGSLLCGCNTAELEDRNFPIEAAVNDTDHFASEWLNAEAEGNRLVDYNHLKVLIISRDFLEDADAMEELLDLLEKKSDLPRNTYVVAAEDAGEIMELGKDMEEPVGKYLEDLLENVSEVKKRAFPTLGMLYQEKENQTETLFFPFVVPEDKKPVVDHYYVWKRGQAGGEIDSSAALLSFFTTNEIKSYTLELSGGEAVKLFAPHNEVSFAFPEEGEDGKKIVVDVNCSGELLSGTRDAGQGLEELVERTEEYMNATAKAALTKRQIDVSDSYKKLGGGNRDWYFAYEKNPGAYERDMDIVYRIHIAWVNL